MPHLPPPRKIPASGFCLDTLTTYCKHDTPAVSGSDTLITYIDYINRYPSIL